MAKSSLASKLPKTKSDVARIGLQVAVRMAADKLKTSEEAVLLDLAEHLRCNFHQLKRYHSTEGLPSFFSDLAVQFFTDRDVRCGRHQFAPTKAVLSTYGILDGDN